jgi:hypothetical protein
MYVCRVIPPGELRVYLSRSGECPGWILIVIVRGWRSTRWRAPAIVSTAGTFEATTIRTLRALADRCVGARARRRVGETGTTFSGNVALEVRP